MFSYTISASNPENIDFQLEFAHEKEFSREEFNEISEEALVYAFEKTHEQTGHVFTASLSTEFITEYLKGKGFISTVTTATYDLEPYWGQESIKSKKLLEWINRDGEDKPPYMK